MREVVLAELRHNARRALGAALAIGIAVAFVVVALGAATSMQDYIVRSTAGQQLAADVVVDPGENRALEAKDVAAVASARGVDGAYAVRTASLKGRFSDGEADVAVTSAPPAALRWYTLVSGREPVASGEVVIDVKTAADARLGLGSTFEAAPRTSSGSSGTPVRLTVVGIAPWSSLSGIGLRPALATDADVAAWGGQDVSQILASAGPAGDPATVRSAVSAALPGVAISSGAAAADQRAGSAAVILGAFLFLFTAVALIVAVIVISNTFAIVLAQRTTQLALVRCLGGTRRQVYRSVLLEALAVGVVSSVAGALAGIGVLFGGAAAVRAAFVEADGLRAVVPPVAVISAVVLGTIVTLVAAWLPARRATRIAPLAALRPDTVEQARRAGTVRIVLGLALTGIGGALLAALTATASAAPSPDGQRGGAVLGLLALGVGCGLITVLGVLLAGPVVVPAVARLLGGTLARFGPVGRLAVTSTVRNPIRASATSMALFVGVCLITLMSVGAVTTTNAVSARIGKDFPVDVSVLGAPPANSSEGQVDPVAVAGSRGLPESAAAALTQLPGVAAAATLRGTTVTIDGTPTVVFTGEPKALQAAVRTPVDLRPGTAIVPADRFDATQKSLVLNASRGAVTMTTTRSSVPVILLAPADFDRISGGKGAVQGAGMLLRVMDDADPQAFITGVRAALTAAGVSSGDTYAAYEGKASVGGSLPQRAEIAQAMGVLLWIATGLLGVALLISLVGIGNTMALSVLERRREIGVLRALGLTRAQLRRTLTLEAVLLALVGTVLGLVLGTGFGYAGARLMLSGVVEVGPVGIPWDRVAMVVVIALGAAVLAAVLPGRRAGRVAPTEALGAT